MKNWYRSWLMQPGRRVRLVTRDAVILERLPYWNLRVQIDGHEEVWWRGNLRLLFCLAI